MAMIAITTEKRHNREGHICPEGLDVPQCNRMTDETVADVAEFGHTTSKVDVAAAEGQPM
jgi:hypothetical protein